MNINVCYLIINILILMSTIIYLKGKDASLKKILMVVGIFLLLTLLSCTYLNNMMNSIFKLKYLDVKVYLVLLIILNIIMLFTINYPIKKIYKILNYLLFAILMIILGATLSVVLGNRFESFYIMDISNAVNFMDLSFVIFFIYLIVTLLIFLGYHLFSKENEKVVTNQEKRTSNIHLPKIKIPRLSLNKNKENQISKPTVLTPEELLNYNYQDGFYINGEECSIIFEDSNKENIVTNYYILNHNIHAKLVNGYTLDENKMLRNICMKLKVGNLSGIDINNISLLNRVTVDEYNLLKKVFGVN